jgi:hydantoinase/carbamoylase family amidase
MDETATAAVDPSRIARDLASLAQIGALADGGITRFAYGDEERRARAYVTEELERVGLTVRIDSAGNLFARLEGRVPNAPAVLSGSHLDTVPRGGRLDGTLGVVAALEAARAIGASGVQLDHPIEVVVFADEEGVRFKNGGLTGSRALVGLLGADDLDMSHDDEGTTLAEALRGWDLDPGRLADARLDPKAIHAFVELHIEQGAVLETAGVPIGVVTGIAAPADMTLRLSGVADHAGATPMTLRHDALAGTAELILAVERIARDEAGPPAVATIGTLNVVPGASNVIPGEVTFMVDVRHSSVTERERLIARIDEEAAAVGRRRGLQTEIVSISRAEPAEMTPVVVQAIEASCRELGYPHMQLPSGAVHDTLNMARIAPVGMIFVPSIGGRSHCPEEDTPLDDIVAGVRVLVGTLVKLAAGSLAE